MALGSNRREIFNTREMLSSTDLNRLQAFVAKDSSESLRYLFNLLGQSRFSNLPVENAVGEADVFGGLIVQPIPSDRRLTVTPGMIGMFDPDSPALPDDSPYKLLRDPSGLSASTTNLTLTSNVSGSIRIDVVECSRVDAIVESDNRNVYDTATGLFAPALVDKVGVGKLQYRIRIGTPGGGIPATPQAHWFPLAVISVPTGTTTSWDACTFWDVRPLVSARNGIANDAGVETGDAFERAYLTADPYSNPGKVEVTGSVRANLLGYRVGGSTFSVQSGIVDARSADFQEPGWASILGAPWFVYLAVPFGFRRFQAYTGPSFQPNGLSGIPVVSNSLPNQDGTRFTIQTPTSTGLNSTCNAICVAAGKVDNAGNVLGFRCGGAGGREFHHETDAASATIAATGTNTVARFNFAGKVPPHAKAVTVLFSGTIDTGLGPVRFSYRVDPLFGSDATKRLWPVPSSAVQNYFDASSHSTSVGVSFVARIPLEWKPGGASTQKAQWTIQESGTAVFDVAPNAIVVGWEL